MTLMKIEKNGDVEVQLETITDEKLQHNDLIIQYLKASNIVLIAYDERPLNILHTFSVINQGKTISFKITHEVFGFGLKVFDIKNMEVG